MGIATVLSSGRGHYRHRPTSGGPSFGKLDEVAVAYATTIHNSQGSEYPPIVIPVVAPHYAMLQRNRLYTGMTRGKRLLVLVGQR